jgi:hypothetical protein
MTLLNAARAVKRYFLRIKTFSRGFEMAGGRARNQLSMEAPDIYISLAVLSTLSWLGFALVLWRCGRTELLHAMEGYDHDNAPEQITL